MASAGPERAIPSTQGSGRFLCLHPSSIETQLCKLFKATPTRSAATAAPPTPTGFRVGVHPGMTRSTVTGTVRDPTWSTSGRTIVATGPIARAESGHPLAGLLIASAAVRSPSCHPTCQARSLP